MDPDHAGNAQARRVASRERRGLDPIEASSAGLTKRREQVKDIWLTAICGVVGGVIINMIFGIIAAQWPASYYSANQLSENQLSSSWLRYLLFRLLPPYIVGTITATTAMRYGINIWWTLLLCALVHLGSTVGKATYLQAKEKRRSNRVLVVNIFVAVLTVGSLALSGATSAWWRPLMPGGDKYVEVAITGAVAAALIFYLQKHTAYRSMAPLILEIEKSIDPALKGHMSSECQRYRVDPDLAMAVLITEVAQRPRWFRTLEKVAAPMGLSYTHGIMQASREARVTDEESVSQAVRMLSGAVFPGRGEHGISGTEPEIRYYLDRHNQGEEFQTFTIEVFHELRSRYKGISPYVGRDGAAGVRVLTTTQDGSDWVITGDAGAEINYIEVVHEPDSSGVAERTEVPIESAGRTRPIWSTRVSIFERTVTFIGYGELEINPRESTDCSVAIYL